MRPEQQGQREKKPNRAGWGLVPQAPAAMTIALLSAG